MKPDFLYHSIAVAHLLFWGSYWLACADCSAAGGPNAVADADFSIQSYAGGPDAAEILRHAIAIRKEACGRWCGSKSTEQWRPRCQIVVHASRVSYLRAVGSQGGQTMGASLIEAREGRIVKRRIDLLVNSQGRCTALAHELTHVVLADWFGGQQPPPWVDEGIATAADTAEKRALHLRDCTLALRSGTAMHLAELLTLDRLANREQAAAFYGQSLSVVAFLAERDTAGKLLPFIDLARQHGYDIALREVYGIAGVGELHRLWLHHEASRPALAQNDANSDHRAR